MKDTSNWNEWLPKGSDFFAKDGWHPNTVGHAIVAERFAAALVMRGA